MSLIDYNNIDIYQEDNLVLKDVIFQVEEGEFIYIIGKVGSGKTSLLKTLYCELDLYKDAEKNEQKAEVLGRDMLTLKRKEVPALRRELGIIFQDFKLLHEKSVRKNLEFILKSTGWKNEQEINERIETTLSDVGLLDKIDKYPHELSGGEQQRVAIARAILNEPKIILADEPTGNLDPETANDIIHLLKNLTKSNTAVVITTHNITMLNKIPGIVYCCKDGAIAEVTKEYNHLDLTEDIETVPNTEA
ncbi:cell division ATP-binding protein FtsE [Prevotella sp. HJM029]|jgi:cell-division ATP-binding protein|uniref:cell division ATP-binding protein FtsE n=1 Tax=Prevotella sp. HJM029 TaxID=1433844 RepID=UPI0004904FC7|nr:ATP-binding cassette domain-containing protein [Prevotella sp. HJM029]MBF1585131.1 ATP-binding cassette domain-containing protein [Prevotella sp.]MBF1586980.1 ATP-binding cassette domain-containing protein [Prevotella sp.]